MFSVRRDEQRTDQRGSHRLPMRWALIISIAAAVAGGAAMVGGPVAAAMTGIGVVGALNALIE